MKTTGNSQLTQEKETLFITLYAKAMDSRSKNSILHDKAADAFIKRIDYDFSKHNQAGSEVMVIRARQFDEWTRDFIRENADAVVVYLGCGLDTRVTRINPPAQVNWFDLDYPEVIEVREAFYSNNGNYRMIAASATDRDWLSQIPNDRPTLIIAEGVLEYFTPEEVKVLLHNLTNYFLHGQIMFDVMNSFAIKAGKKKLQATTGAVHKWAVDDISTVDTLNTKLQRVTCLPVFKSVYMRKLGTGWRVLLALLCVFPAFKNMLRLLRYRF
jgi:methyltransferase (TIGR00027 family)